MLAISAASSWFGSPTLDQPGNANRTSGNILQSYDCRLVSQYTAPERMARKRPLDWLARPRTLQSHGPNSIPILAEISFRMNFVGYVA